MSEDSSLRMVLKLFKCPICLYGFKKLVHIDEIASKCPNCGHEHCTETINSEFNRESVDQQYRLPFCNLPENVRRQYHTVTDIRDKSPGNLYQDNQRNRHPTSNYQNTNNTTTNNHINFIQWVYFIPTNCNTIKVSPVGDKNAIKFCPNI